MSIIKRAKRNTPFVQIDKTPLQDKNLSLKAKGLLAYLLSLPDNWQIYVSELQNHSKDGRDSTRTALNELIDAGYVLREKKRDKGKFKGYNYTVSDTKINCSVSPKTEKPKTGKPKTGKPKTENQPLIIKQDNNITNTNKREKETPTQKNVSTPPSSDMWTKLQVTLHNYKMPFSKNLNNHLLKYWKYMEEKKGHNWGTKTTVLLQVDKIKKHLKTFSEQEIIDSLEECQERGNVTYNPQWTKNRIKKETSNTYSFKNQTISNA